MLKDETRRPRVCVTESWLCDDGLVSFDRMTIRGWGVERISIRTLVERGEWARVAATRSVVGLRNCKIYHWYLQVSDPPSRNVE